MDIKKEFPYEEIRKEPDGDYFDTEEELEAQGFAPEQIWAVMFNDDMYNDSEWICYGPPHHYVNVIGYIATQERHDHDTYYFEEIVVDA